MNPEPPNEILVTNTCARSRVCPLQTQKIIATVLTHFACNHCQVDVSFVDSDTIQKLNLQYRQKDKSTDVLSFPQIEPMKIPPEPLVGLSSDLLDPPKTLGDIVICPEVAFQNARNIGQNIEREISFLLIHGMLHLLGFDHIQFTDKEIMNKKESILMDKVLQEKLHLGCIEANSFQKETCHAST